MKTEEYLTSLTNQIRCKMARKDIRDEMKSHIEDQTAAFMREGMTQEQAENAAIAEMGDPVETGMLLDRIHRPKMAWGMIFLIGLLTLAGFVFQYLLEISIPDALFANGLKSGQFVRHLIMLAVGLAIMTAICFCDYSRIGCHAKELTLLLAAALFLGLIFFGVSINGSPAWISLPGNFSFNAEILCYLFIPLYGGILFQYRGQGYSGIAKSALWMLPVPCISIFCSGTLTTLIFLAAIVLILSIAVMKNWFQVSRSKTLALLWSSLLLLPILLFLLGIHFGAEYQQARLLSIFTGEQESFLHSSIRSIISESRLAGSGAHSAILHDFLTYMGKDYMLLYLIASYGILATVLIFGIMAFLFLRFLGLALKQRSQMGMIMGAGCSIVLLLQMLFYILINLGLMPMGSSSCPFFTLGGSWIVVNYTLLGIMLSIYRYQNVISERQLKRRLIKFQIFRTAPEKTVKQ